MIQNQYGNVIFVPSGIDLSTATEITVTLTRPHTSIVWTLTGATLAIGVVDLVVGAVTYPAETYVQHTFLQGEITQAGNYKVTLSALINGKFCPGATGCFRVAKQVGPCAC